jgi:hypothetical protein
LEIIFKFLADIIHKNKEGIERHFIDFCTFVFHKATDLGAFGRFQFKNTIFSVAFSAILSQVHVILSIKNKLFDIILYLSPQKLWVEF